MKFQQVSTVADVSGLYDEDFFAWTRRNAELLRAGQLEQAAIEHIAEEVEDMGKRDLRELNSRVQVLLMHLLQWQWQPEKHSRSWRRTIINRRIKLETLLQESPSLRSKSQDYIETNYEKAAYLAAFETGPPVDRFPSQCPFGLAQILDRSFLP